MNIAVESGNTQIPRMAMYTSINNTLFQCTYIISLIKGAKVSTKTTCDIIRFSIVYSPIDGKLKGNGWKRLKKNIFMNGLDNGAFLYSNSCIATKGYHYEKWLLKCNNDQNVLVKRKILK